MRALLIHGQHPRPQGMALSQNKKLCFFGDGLGIREQPLESEVWAQHPTQAAVLRWCQGVHRTQGCARHPPPARAGG